VVLVPVRVLGTFIPSGPVCRIVHRCFRKAAILCKRAAGVGETLRVEATASKALKRGATERTGSNMRSLSALATLALDADVRRGTA
jgi:hypothetical protein